MNPNLGKTSIYRGRLYLEKTSTNIEQCRLFMLNWSGVEII
jgi:hypothetical protein